MYYFFSISLSHSASVYIPLPFYNNSTALTFSLDSNYVFAFCSICLLSEHCVWTPLIISFLFESGNPKRKGNNSAIIESYPLTWGWHWKQKMEICPRIPPDSFTLRSDCLPSIGAWLSETLLFQKSWIKSSEFALHSQTENAPSSYSPPGR